MGESKLLKWTGIIMIIGGGLMTLISLIGLLGGIIASGGSQILGGLIILLTIIGLAASVLQLVAGIMGAKNWNQPAKAQGCFVIGVVIIAVSLLSNVGSIWLSGFAADTVFDVLLGLVLPGLYTYGAYQLKTGA